MNRWTALVLLLASCAHRPPPPDPPPFIPTDLELQSGAIGVVRVVETGDGSYEATLIFPEKRVTGSWAKFRPSKDYWKDSAPIAFRGQFELFDDKGPLGHVSIAAGSVRFWCENDGGTQYRPEFRLTLNRSSLPRPLRPVAALQGIAAFVRAVSPEKAADASPQTLEAGTVALRGDLDGDGRHEALVTTLPDEADNCDGAPANNLTLTLQDGAGAWPLRCCGP